MQINLLRHSFNILYSTEPRQMLHHREITQSVLAISNILVVVQRNKTEQIQLEFRKNGYSGVSMIGKIVN